MHFRNINYILLDYSLMHIKITNFGSGFKANPSSGKLLKFSEPDRELNADKEQHSMTVTFPDRAILCISAGLIIFSLTAVV